MSFSNWLNLAQIAQKWMYVKGNESDLKVICRVKSQGQSKISEMLCILLSIN